MKKCKYCDEEIEDDAIVCKHCGNDLIPRKSPRPLKKRGPGRIALIGLGVLILAFIISFAEEELILRTPYTKWQAIWPGLLVGLVGWVGIILLIVALVRTIQRRKKPLR